MFKSHTSWVKFITRYFILFDAIIYQFSSVTQSCQTLCDPMDCSTPGLPVHHQLPKLAQTHVHRVGDAIQLSHPLLSPSPPAFNLSQHQGLFKWVSSSHQGAKILEFQLQHQSLPMNIRDWFPLEWTVWISVLSKGISKVFFHTIVQRHQFFGTELSLYYNSHILTREGNGTPLQYSCLENPMNRGAW